MSNYRGRSAVGTVLTVILVIALLGGVIWGITYFAKSCDKTAEQPDYKISYIDSGWYARNNVNNDKQTMTVTEKAYKTGYVMTFTPAAIEGYEVESIKTNAAGADISVSDDNVVTVTVPADIDKDTFSVMVFYKRAAA